MYKTQDQPDLHSGPDQTQKHTMLTLSLTKTTKQTQKASAQSWCVEGQGYQGRRFQLLDHTPVMASAFAAISTLNPEAPQ